MENVSPHGHELLPRFGCEPHSARIQQPSSFGEAPLIARATDWKVEYKTGIRSQDGHCIGHAVGLAAPPFQGCCQRHAGGVQVHDRLHRLR